MFNLPYRAAVREFVRPKFKGEPTLISRYAPLYPYSSERDYIRLVFEFMEIFKKVTIKYIPKIDLYLKSQGLRQDDDEEPVLSLNEIFFLMEREIDNKIVFFDLRARLNRLANVTRKLSISEWKKAVFRTLGVNILEDYYDGAFYGHIIPEWIEDNVNRIVTIPRSLLGDMKTLTQKGFYEGKTINRIIWDIQEKYEMTRRHARLIARDQTGKLYGKLAKSQQEDAGIDEYIWSGVMDNRERESHVDREGDRYRWGELGESHEPGQEIQCRCIAVPVFNWSNLDLPISPEQPKKRMEELMYG
jgi:SPP1 gp7 family putative phage head morphogenesis protein